MSIAELQQAKGQLDAASDVLDHAGQHAADFLLDGGLRVGLLRLVAFGTRLPLPTTEVAEGAELLEAQRDLYFEASRMLFSMLYASLPSPACTAAQVDLARGLLRTQALHAAARQLAGAAAPTAEAQSKAAAACLFSATNTLFGLFWTAWHTRGGKVLLPGLAAAVAESHVLEHAARLLLCLRRAAAAGAALASTAAAVEAPTDRARLAQPLSGPCAQHAALVVGLEALGVLEGAEGAGGQGPCPCACLSGPPGEYQTLGSALIGLVWALHPTLGEGPTSPDCITAARLLLRLGSALVASAADGGGPAEGPAEGQVAGTVVPPPHQRAALTPADRTMVLKSTVPMLLDRVPYLDYALQPLSRSTGTRSQPQAPAVVADVWRLLSALLRPEGLAGLEQDTVRRMLQRLPELLVASGDAFRKSSSSPVRAWDWASSFRRPLYALLRPELHGPVSDEGTLGSIKRRLAKLLEACSTADLGAGFDTYAWALPAEPAPPLAAALAGGALPLLERLLRRAGEAPEGLESSLLYDVAHIAPSVRQRLSLVLSSALPQWLPELSRLALQAAALDEAAWREEQRGEAQAQRGRRAQAQRGRVQAQRGRPPPAGRQPGRRPGAGQAASAAESAASTELIDYLSFLLLVLSAHAKHVLGDKGSRSPLPKASLTTGGEASGSAAGSSAASTVDGARPLAGLLRGEDLVSLVGAALGLLERRRPEPPHMLYVKTISWAARLSSSHPAAVRAALSPKRAHPWRPSAVRAAAEALRSTGDRGPDTAAAEALAGRLQAWAAGEEAAAFSWRWAWAWAWAEVLDMARPVLAATMVGVLVGLLALAVRALAH
ncbi:hypothetical protein HYH03_005845 [Edaphochlamys debaryana]|uniref:Uncharacterized protein n=1 Tax=Edaphochlamys debaryana TaxID=47281 RepID=A0A835Y4F9_9CHLO|nr:hypothetical protein HYH03_005845 [Edaphochlamys debaryana]|eukprot:KAG2496247.1 hypothetical protein HYH03_005845 [Edaphochlamys debaryana]